MCSLSCVHTLQQRRVAYSQSLLITARFLHWRLLKILLSSFILPFYILKILALKRMCSLFSCSLLSCSLLCQNRKRNWNKNYAKFASSSLAFSIFQAHHFYISIFFYFFLFNCSVGSSCKKTILQTHSCFIYMLFANAHVNIATWFFELCYSFETFAGVLFPEFFIAYVYLSIWAWIWTLSGVAKLKKIFTQKE